MNKKLLIVLVVLVGFLLAGVGAAVYYGYTLVNTDTIRMNVFIEDTDVSGLTYDEALSKMQKEKKQSMENVRINLKHGDTTWKVDSADVQFKFGVEKAVDEAYSVARSGNYLQDFSTMFSLQSEKKTIKIEKSYNMDVVKTQLAGIAKDIDQEMKEGSFNLGPNGPVITGSQVGYKVDVLGTLEEVESFVKANTPGNIELKVAITEPKLKSADLEKMTDRLAVFHTYFDTGYVERAHNVRLAASKVNGALIMPGETLSIDKQVGPRTMARGFQNSKIIVNNKYEDGIGGGLCQVSTTLYNAALYANLDIVARKNHSIVSSYIAPGRDSTVFNSDKDLKIKNNRALPIYIKSYTIGGALYFEIYGKKEADDKRIVIRTSTVSHTPAGMDLVEDPTMYVGKSKIEFEPHDGYVVKTYKDVYLGNEKLETVYLGLSSYNKSNGIKLVGTKEKPKKDTSTPTPEPENTETTTGDN